MKVLFLHVDYINFKPLKKALKTKDMYKNCRAGKRDIVIGETGKVFPCEPLWQSVGDLRNNNYDINRIMDSDEMKKFNKKIIEGKISG